MLRTNLQTANGAFAPAAFVKTDFHAWVERLASRVGALTETVTGQRARRAGRLRLALLDAHLLRDIGLTRDDIRREMTKPFWRI